MVLEFKTDKNVAQYCCSLSFMVGVNELKNMSIGLRDSLKFAF